MSFKFLICTLSFLSFSASAAKPEAFQLRKYETQTLANGMTLMWIPDAALPYVTLEMMVRTGSSQDPTGREGLADFTAGMLEKGTKSRTAGQISEELEQIGSGISASVEPDYTMITSSVLSFNRDSMLKQFGEIVLQPTFTNAELEKYRKRLLAGLQKLADHPEEFVGFLMPHFLFGAHPYGHEPSGNPKSIKSIKRNDLQSFYATNFTPDSSTLAIVGQYDEKFKQAVVKTFEGWKAKAKINVNLPDFPQWKGREILLVDRGDLNQAQIEIGFKGVPRNMPEYLEMRAALKILGESFGSRLFDEIRVKRALTYHINAWFDPRLIAGPMGIYTFTRVDKIGETVEETLKTYKKFVNEGVTESEVNDVKALMRGQFPRMFETPEALGKQLLVLNRYGISPEYLTHYLDNLQSINKNSVNATIKKYFDIENLKILVYAPRAKAEEPLKKLGKVEVRGYKEFLQ